MRRFCIAECISALMEKIQKKRGQQLMDANDLLPDLTNPDELRKAIIAAELLHPKYV